MSKKRGQQPLVIFTLLAGIIFLMDSWIQKRTPYIDINKQTVHAILYRQAALKGGDLSEDEKQQAIEDYINKQVLLKEALRLGLDKDLSFEDKLIRKLRAISTVDIPEPTESDLLKYYSKHATQYRSPALWDIEHWAFNINDAMPASFIASVQENKSMLDKMNRTTANKIHFFSLTKIPDSAIIMRMGPDAYKLLRDAQPNEWIGPAYYREKQYFFRYTERSEPEAKPFNEVRSYVYSAWKSEQQDLLMQEKLNALKQQYTIKVAALNNTL